jgi:SAM-dependent methyltransferase
LTSPRNLHNEKIGATYTALADTNVLTDTFQHGAIQRELFAQVMTVELERLAGRDSPAVLDAGCGTGAWIETLRALASTRLPAVTLYGFDLTPAMIDIAEKRLSATSESVHLSVGDVLDDEAYSLRPGGRYDLIYAYDVVQQLPRGDQVRVIETFLRHLSPGGSLVVFDHEAHSVYGVLMGTGKKLTRLGLPVLPSYYLTARYPKLARIENALSKRPGTEATIIPASNRRKRALVVRVPSADRNG